MATGFSPRQFTRLVLLAVVYAAGCGGSGSSPRGPAAKPGAKLAIPESTVEHNGATARAWYERARDGKPAESVAACEALGALFNDGGMEALALLVARGDAAAERASPHLTLMGPDLSPFAAELLPTARKWLASDNVGLKAQGCRLAGTLRAAAKELRPQIEPLANHPQLGRVAGEALSAIGS
jgi:hypothetical protein